MPSEYAKRVVADGPQTRDEAYLAAILEELRAIRLSLSLTASSPPHDGAPETARVTAALQNGEDKQWSTNNKTANRRETKTK